MKKSDSGLQLEFRSKSMGNFRDINIIESSFNSIRRTRLLENKNIEQSLLDSSQHQLISDRLRLR
ncbi:MAG: hypothetical protein IPN18_17005 [Ignavibacteriales bacterium]|nr:hypothetical protein [Ignavibacteriales bacterium]